MAYTDTWDSTFEGEPQDTDNIADGADDIRDAKLAMRERMQSDHYMDPAGTDADHGEHALITLREQSAPGNPEVNKAFLYGFEADSVCELHFKDESNNIIQLTRAGRLNEGLFKDEDDMVSNSDEYAPTQQSVKAYADTMVPIALMAGIVQRGVLTHVDDDTLTLGACVYPHIGTATQLLYCAEALTFDFGPGGSNAASAAVATSGWNYLYIDDSALSGNVLTAARLLNNTTAPTWNAAKHGWYNNLDLCIGAILSDADDDLLPWWHDGGDLFMYDLNVQDLTAQTIENDWADTVTLTLPGFCTKGLVTFEGQYIAVDDFAYYYRPTGSSSNGHRVALGHGGSGYVIDNTNSMIVFCDTSQSIDVRVDQAIDQKLSVYTNGYYFPGGM